MTYIYNIYNKTIDKTLDKTIVVIVGCPKAVDNCVKHLRGKGLACG